MVMITLLLAMVGFMHLVQSALRCLRRSSGCNNEKERVETVETVETVKAEAPNAQAEEVAATVAATTVVKRVTPTVVYTTRFGECFHMASTCCALKQSKVAKLRPCSYCCGA